MLGGGGVDGAIHRAAGVGLRGACERVKCVSPGVRCPTGEARITDAFRLPVDKVIHTVGPIYKRKRAELSAKLLRSAYATSLELAAANGVTDVAFPAISCGGEFRPAAAARGPTKSRQVPPTCSSLYPHPAQYSTTR